MNNKAKLLKKSIIVLVLILVTSTAVFASNGETLNIGGVVPLILTLTVAPDANADNLNLTATDLPVTPTLASISVETNNTAGWELWIYSVNGGTLNNSEPTADTISYTLSYAGTGGVSTTAPAPSNTGVLFGQSAFPGVVEDSSEALTINYTQSVSGYQAGYYSDQLTLVLRAK